MFAARPPHDGSEVVARGRSIDRWRIGLGMAYAVAVAASVVRGAAAQTALPLAEPARAIATAFRALADAAATAVDDADWQRVDDTYNNVLLAAIDLHRPALLGAGDAARPAVEAIDAALARVGAALDALDAARIRAEADRVGQALDSLAPGVAGGAPTIAAALAEWRAHRDASQRLADRQRAGEDTWRDLRNEAIALIDSLDARGAAVAAAVPGQAATVDRLTVLALRLRMAALTQAADETAAALRLVDADLDALDRAAATAGVPAPAPAASLVFEGQPVVATPGQAVEVGIVARGVAEAGGLGGFVLDIRWSPRALRMERVEWAGLGGSAASATDAAAGHYVLELPPAPVGPEVDTQVASLIMTVLGVTPDPNDYVPVGSMARLEAALDAAAVRARAGDVAAAGADVFGAYVEYVDGRGVPGSLASRFASVGQATVVEAAWLELLRRLSLPEPAGTDAVVEAVDGARSALAGAVAAYGAALAADGGIPITIDVVSATDLRGQPLATRPSVTARVLTTGLVTPAADTAVTDAAPDGRPPDAGAAVDVPAAADGDAPAPPAASPAVPAPTAPPDGPAATGRDARRLGALVLAALAAGGLGALASARRAAR